MVALVDHMLHVKIIFDHNDLLTPPPGNLAMLKAPAHSVIVVHLLYLKADTTAAAYTNVGDLWSDFIYATSLAARTDTAHLASLFTPQAKQVAILGPYEENIIGHEYHQAPVVPLANEYEGGILLVWNNSLGTMAGGDPANTLTCDLYYSIVDVG
jgi:hypothetical protein